MSVKRRVFMKNVLLKKTCTKGSDESKRNLCSDYEHCQPCVVTHSLKIKKHYVHRRH